MDQEVALVLNGYLSLTQVQRSDFIDYLNSYNQGGQDERDRITRESTYRGVRKVDVGPITTGICPCCHR